MYNPPALDASVDNIHIHEDIHCCCLDLLLNVAKILESRKQRFNKRLLLCHRFFTLSVPAVLFYVTVRTAAIIPRRG